MVSADKNRPEGIRRSIMATVSAANAISREGLQLHETSVNADRETARAVRARLQTSGYYYLRALECDCQRGKLVLRGCLPTYYLKQVAQTLASRTPGVESVANEIEIADPERCVAASQASRWTRTASQAVASA